jgi:hypothetical protein
MILRRMMLVGCLVCSTATIGLAAVAFGHDGHGGHGKVVAHASYADWSCHTWASHDPAHPNAPDSYRSYGCSNPGGDYAWVIGTGKYTYTIHSTKLRRQCLDSLPLLGCLSWRVTVVEHGHS